MEHLLAADKLALAVQEKGVFVRVCSDSRRLTNDPIAEPVSCLYGGIQQLIQAQRGSVFEPFGSLVPSTVGEDSVSIRSTPLHDSLQACNSSLFSFPPVQHGAPAWSGWYYEMTAMLDAPTDKERKLFETTIPEEGSHLAELTENGDWKFGLVYCCVEHQKHREAGLP